VEERERFLLGKDTGSSTDAELYAIKAALELAVRKVDGALWICHVRILSDCASVLQGLESGKTCDLGPAVSSTWALQDVYDLTYHLISKNITVDLVWVKGHALSTGNLHADHIAGKAVLDQGTMARKWGLMRKEEILSFIRRMGIDSEKEWLWRANKV